MANSEAIGVFFVGNRLMLDDGVGPMTYDYILENFVLPGNVELYDVGCMSMDMISKVNDFDFMITVDAVDEIDAPVGTIFRYEPHDIARTTGPSLSLHELKLADLFDAASILGYSCEGMCYGMRVENVYPSEFVVGLTPDVEAALPRLAEAVLAELWRHGCIITYKDGRPFGPGE